MEYEKFIVSLYEAKSKTQSGVFLYVEKRADKSTLSIKNSPSDYGFVFVYFNGKCIFVPVNKKLSFNFDEEFSDNNDYLFCFYCESKKYFGKKGNIKEEKKILSAIENKYQTVKNLSISELEFDKNNVIDDLMQKMFGLESELYFKLAKAKLSNIFACFERCEMLEEKFKNSKFVKSENGIENSFAGIIYKRNKPFAIAVGFAGNEDEIFADERYNFYSINTVCGNKGIFLSFRRASDGDIVKKI